MPIAPYAMPQGPHIRRHGPFGYRDYGAYKEWLRDEFQFRCVFCLHREKWERRGWRVFQIDHLTPQSVDYTQVCNYENLLYVCDSCNGYKSNKLLPDPCTTAYGQHYQFEDDGSVKALTRDGEFYIEILGLDEPYLVSYRRAISKLIRDYEAIAQISDTDLTEELEKLLGYPSDLKDLRRLTPKGNSKPGSEQTCYYVRLMNGEIPRLY